MLLLLMQSFHQAFSFINFLGLAFCTCEVSQETHLTARTHDKVCYSPKSMVKKYAPISAAIGVESAMKLLGGRWKLVILFHLSGGKVLRQQLRSLAADGIIVRTAYP